MKINADLYEKKISWLADCFGAKLSKIRADLYLETVILFPLDVVQQVFKDFARQSKSMPTVADVEKECIAKRNFLQSQQPIGKGNMKCQYSCQDECLTSRGMCAGYAAESEVHHSLMMYGTVFCNWHQMVAYAKKYPQNTVEVEKIRFLINDMKKIVGATNVSASGIEERAAQTTRSISNLAQGWRNAAGVQEGVLNRV